MLTDNVEYESLIQYEMFKMLSNIDHNNCFMFSNKHTVANNQQLRDKSKAKEVALEYAIIQGYCVPQEGETGIKNLFWVTEKGLDFLNDYEFYNL